MVKEMCIAMKREMEAYDQLEFDYGAIKNRMKQQKKDFDKLITSAPEEDSDPAEVFRWLQLIRKLLTADVVLPQERFQSTPICVFDIMMAKVCRENTLHIACWTFLVQLFMEEG